MNINKNIKVSETKTLPVQYGGKDVKKLKFENTKTGTVVKSQILPRAKLVFSNLQKIAEEKNTNFKFTVVLPFETTFITGQTEIQNRSSKVYDTAENTVDDIDLFNAFDPDLNYDSGVVSKAQQNFSNFQILYW